MKQKKVGETIDVEMHTHQQTPQKHVQAKTSEVKKEAQNKAI